MIFRLVDLFSGICYLKMQNKQEAKNTIESFFPHIGKIISIQKIIHNEINSKNFFINSSSGKYVLHKFRDGSSPQKMEKICEILDFCAKNHTKVPIPIRNNKNHFVEKNHSFYLTQFIPGSEISKSTKNLDDLAKQLSSLHIILNKKSFNYNYRIGERFYKNLSKIEFSLLTKKLSKKNNEDSFDRLILKNLKFLETLTFETDFEKQYNKLKFEKQLIHFDLHPRNILFTKNKVSGILDFNAMRRGFVIQDVVFSSFRFAILQTNTPLKIKNFVQNFINLYMNHNPIPKQSEYAFHILQHTLLGRVNYILKKRYFFNSNTWIDDLTRNLSSLILVNKILLLQK